MRKTILLLINGFGIERKGSAEVYSAKLMPAFDNMTKTCLFGSLTTTAGDYNTAYKLFSIPEVTKEKEDEIDKMIEDHKFNTIPLIAEIANDTTVDKNIHIFYSFESANKYNQVCEFIKTINPNKNKKIFVHLILFGTSTAKYDEIAKLINKISFELGEYAKVGFVVGKNKIDEDDVLRAFYREQGEYWNQVEKKFDILKRDVINPEDAGAFIVSKGFTFKENDTVIVANYEPISMEKLMSELATKQNSKKYSFFPFKEGIPNIFTKDNISAQINFASLIEKFGIKILALTSSNKLDSMNFYLNGMEKKKSTNITYALNDKGLFSTKESTISLIENPNYDGFILDFEIGEYAKMEEIKSELSSLDTIIKNISEASREKNYTFIISSLYGMHAPVTDGVVQKVIDFSGKVPCVYQNNEYIKGAYALNSGSTYALEQTFLTNICDDVRSNKLVHKQSGLEKMLSKK